MRSLDNLSFKLMTIERREDSIEAKIKPKLLEKVSFAREHRVLLDPREDWHLTRLVINP